MRDGKPGSILPLFAMLVLLAGCNADGTLNAQTQAAVLKACQVDATVQPVAVVLAPMAGPAGAVAGAVDNAAVHPQVVAACAQAAANKAPVAAVAGAVSVPVTVAGQAVTVTVTPVAPVAK